MHSSQDKPLLSHAQQSVLHLLAFQCLWNGQPQKAQPLYELLLSVTPDAVQVLTGLACARLQNGAPESALQLLEPLADGSDPAVLLLLARALSLTGDRSGAAEAMERFCKLRPKWSGRVLVDAENQMNQKKNSATGVPKNA